jgi:predicted Zn-dependent protease
LRTPKFVLALGAAFLLAAAVAGPAVKTAGASPVAAAAQEAKTFTHEAGGITFELPEGWKAEPNGDQLMVAPEGGGFSVFFWVAEEDNFDAALKEIDDELAKQLKNVKLDGEPKTDTHNGMQHASVSGSGQANGKDVLFSADVLAAKKPVIVLTVGVADEVHKHADDYIKLVKSIKKVG